MSKPRLRFAGANLASWEQYRIEDLFDGLSGKGLSKSDVVADGKNECILYGSLFGAPEVISSIDSYTNSDDGTPSCFGDVLVPTTDVTMAGLVTATTLLKDSVLVGGDIMILRPKLEMDTSFFAYLYRSRGRDLRPLSVGTSVKHLHFSKLKRLSVEMPSLPEQQKIASFFSALDQRIDAQRRLVELLREQKKGYMQKIFSRELRFLDEDGNEYPEWEETTVDQTGTVVTGNTPSTSEDRFWKGDDVRHVWITPTDISQRATISSGARGLTSEGFAKARKIPAGSVLVTSIASIGKNAILTTEGSCNQQINAVVPRSGYDSRFLYYAMCVLEPAMKRLAGNTATPILNKNTFGSMPLSVPVLAEQQKIGNLLYLLDERIDRNEDLLKSLNAQKTYYVNNML